ncbi:type VI secretion system baseplate subunit TssG [Paracidobacterium acidisoli]|uniref:Type VI secretion system baseplate subunit TssG n=1 Tax=Paracidobacterium acidisoli TaxID=2303751 RepID=A0A372IR12_9BACT|nr:type VI secretion system baseplate subunit TssG [Paracidobacterium acidisoli]MBT9330205.1 type VI secretion system baseplate subunit TssG [Paracidobacterium acidisoli]
MATQSGQQTTDLTQQSKGNLQPLRALLDRDPYSVRFFQAVRLLERLYPDRHPVGLFVSPSAEVVRFSSVPSLSFPASEIQAFEEKAGSAKLSVNFMGLSAAVGTLPHPYTEFLLERARAKDRGPAEFFDVFNHRVISLFYRAWQKYRFYIAYERTGAGDDVISARLMDLIGLGTKGLQHRMGVADEACLYYTGLLAQRRPTAQGLKQLIEDYFDMPVQVQQFTGVWKRLPPTNLTFLRDSGMFCERLGMGTIVGDEVWDQHGTVTLRLGPMNFERYQQFLPGADASRELHAWLRIYASREIDFIIQLVLEREQTPGMKLGETGPSASRLGLVSWIKNRPLGHDPDEATYRLS